MKIKKICIALALVNAPFVMAQNVNVDSVRAEASNGSVDVNRETGQTTREDARARFNRMMERISNAQSTEVAPSDNTSVRRTSGSTRSQAGGRFTANSNGDVTADCNASGNASCNGTSSGGGNTISDSEQSGSLAPAATSAPTTPVTAVENTPVVAQSMPSITEQTSSGSTRSQAGGRFTANSNGDVTADCNATGDARCSGTSNGGGNTATDSAESGRFALADDEVPVIAKQMTADVTPMIDTQADTVSTSGSTVSRAGGRFTANSDGEVTADCNATGNASCNGTASGGGNTVSDSAQGDDFVATADDTSVAPRVTDFTGGTTAAVACANGQFTVTFNTSPLSNCTADQTLTVDGVQVTESVDFVGALERVIALPFGSVASVNLVYSCMSDNGSLKTSASANTAVGCADIEQSNEEKSEVIAQLKQSIDMLLEELHQNVERTQSSIERYSNDGRRDATDFAQRRVDSIERSQGFRIDNIVRSFQDRVLPEVLDAQLELYNEAAATLLNQIK